MSTFFGKAVEGYAMSPQGQVDMFFMAQDQLARVAPSMIRQEARALRYEDADQLQRRKDMAEAVASGDTDKITGILQQMGMATMFDDGGGTAPNADKPKDPIPSAVDAKLDILIGAMTQLTEKLGSK